MLSTTSWKVASRKRPLRDLARCRRRVSGCAAVPSIEGTATPSRAGTTGLRGVSCDQHRCLGSFARRSWSLRAHNSKGTAEDALQDERTLTLICTKTLGVIWHDCTGILVW